MPPTAKTRNEAASTVEITLAEVDSVVLDQALEMRLPHTKTVQAHKAMTSHFDRFDTAQHANSPPDLSLPTDQSVGCAP